MPVLRVPVECSRCSSRLDASAAISIDSAKNRFACYGCYQKLQPSKWGVGDEVKIKHSFYCGKCKFKFKSYKPKCTYCGSMDHVMGSQVSVHDLL